MSSRDKMNFALTVYLSIIQLLSVDEYKVTSLFRLYPIGHVNKIPTMQFCPGIPKNTQSELYYIILYTASLPEKSWEFQNNALWDTH